MAEPIDEESLLRSAALHNAHAIRLARQRAEDELVRAREALELRTRELGYSLARLRATLESTTDGILVTDEHGLVADFNENYVRLWDVPRQVMASRQHTRVLEAIAQSFRDPSTFVARATEIQRSRDDSFDVLELADGRVFERYSKVQCVEGRDTGRVWSVRDISAYRRAEETLRDEARLLELLNKTGELLASKLDLHLLAQTVTETARDVTGAAFGAFFYRAAGATGDGPQLYAMSGVRPEDTQALCDTAPSCLTTRPIRCDDVFAAGMPRGPLGAQSYLTVPVISRSGEVIGGLFFGHPEAGVFTERSERLATGIAAQAGVAFDNARLYEAAQTAAEERRHLLESEQAARAEAERASSMKDEFLATLSHEVRTPLSAIFGWVKLLRSPTVTPADLRRGLEVIERNTHSQIQLIEDLLDMSRITSGQLRLSIVPLQLETVVQAALETVRPAANAKDIQLQFHVASTAMVAGDPSRIEQVVWNLLSNAIKFTGRNGWVRVHLCRVGESVELSVVDTGIGITPEFLPHVFDRFRQADGSITRQAGGLGLGLAIVKHLITLHGGSVTADSPGSGAGATFTVRLPVLTPRSRSAGEHGAEPDAREIAGISLAGVRVLVVDDDGDSRYLIHSVLHRSGADVTAVASAADAVPALERERPDVLIADIGMPTMDGYELLRLVRALGQSRGGNVPVIALTAFARPEDRTRALRAGFAVHHAKPFEPTELVATVAQVVRGTSSP